MRILFVGDFVTDTGPAMANKQMLKGLEKKNTHYVKSTNNYIRIIELFLKLLISDCICFCSYSKINFIGNRLAKLFGKKTFYIMHGYKTLEVKLNDQTISKEKLFAISSEEQELFSQVDKIFCVSKKFMEYMRKAERNFAYKFDYNYNAVDIKKIQSTSKTYINEKKMKQIISLGGGMKQKNNLSVCRAIDKLNREKDLNLKYIVVGKPYTEKDKIKSYDFVTYYDELPHDKVLELLSESNLYIQNSTFETFGLTIIEALIANCNLLISNNVGALGVLNSICDDDIIFDHNNIEEISTKIENVITSNNLERLKSGILYEKIDIDKAAKSLYSKIIKSMSDK